MRFHCNMCDSKVAEKYVNKLLHSNIHATDLNIEPPAYLYEAVMTRGFQNIVKIDFDLMSE